MKRLIRSLFNLPERWRRFAFIARAELKARLLGIDLTLNVHPSVRFGRDVRLRLSKGEPIKVTIGQKVEIEDHVKLDAHAGSGTAPELYIGPYSVIHQNAYLCFGGLLRLEFGNEVGIGTVIRAMQAVDLNAFCGTGEYVSIYDFFHATDDNLETTYQRTLVCSPIKIGRAVLIATKATVNPGTVIADLGIVFPHAVITGVHEDPANIYVGIPAKRLDRLELWPLTNNPLIAAALTWQHDKPGPNFKTPEEALAELPEPARYQRELHGWDARMRRMEQARGEESPSRLTPGGEE